jgi:transcriptional regulator of arginine metabolism
MSKSYRHGQILKLIHSRRVYTQQELADALGASGISATQVTLSRDIRELGLVKTSQGYAESVETAPSGPDLTTVIREFLLDVRVAQNLLVLKTPPASASPLAEVLDQADWPEITGTIAGENTVLVVAPDAGTAQVLQQKLLQFLG